MQLVWFSPKQESVRCFRATPDGGDVFVSAPRLWLGDFEVLECDLESWFGVDGSLKKGKTSRASVDGVLNLVKVGLRKGKPLGTCYRCFQLYNKTDTNLTRIRRAEKAAEAKADLECFPQTRSNASLQTENVGLKMELEKSNDYISNLFDQLESLQTITDDQADQLHKVRLHLGDENIARGTKNAKQRDRDRLARVAQLRQTVKKFGDLEAAVKKSSSAVDFLSGKYGDNWEGGFAKHVELINEQEFIRDEATNLLHEKDTEIDSLKGRLDAITRVKLVKIQDQREILKWKCFDMQTLLNQEKSKYRTLLDEMANDTMKMQSLSDE